MGFVSRARVFADGGWHSSERSRRFVALAAPARRKIERPSGFAATIADPKPPIIAPLIFALAVCASAAAFVTDASAQGGPLTPRESAPGAKAAAGATTSLAPATSPLPPVSIRMTLVADRDDDDADMKPDGEAETVGPGARVDLVALDPSLVGAVLTPVAGQELARVLVGGKPFAWGEKVPAGAQLQGLAPGRTRLTARIGAREIGVSLDVVGVGLRDGARRAVDMAREYASLDRTPPTRVNLDDPEEGHDDADALRVVLTAPSTESPAIGALTIESLSAEGQSLDTVVRPKLAATHCDAPGALTCLATPPIRFVVDDVDRAHALVANRSLRAEVGGAIVVRDANGRKLQAIRVAGPRKTSAGPLGRYRMTIRPIVMRLTPGGAPSVGGTDAGATAALRQELAAAASAWGQCGITFGPVAQLDVKVVNPPPPYLVAIGDDVGLPASGGSLRLRVGGKTIAMTTKPGWSTRQVALELQRSLEKSGLKAVLSENARIASGASPSVDVAVRNEQGQLATVELVAATDPTLSVAVGAVDLSDGLQHFGDTDSVAGTLEERTLVKSVDDGDPRTVEVIVIPFFGGGGRIGESFIGSDGSSMRNVVIIDRAGVRARRTSLTLAHELGHVILDEPGHPDDYGIDTPTLLMDSDASDSSPFGPRRVTNEECARAFRQSGPVSPLPLFTDWKLTPLKIAHAQSPRAQIVH